jgi:type I restriction enzyme R subunit
LTIVLPRGVTALDPMRDKGGYTTPANEMDVLSQIIRTLNERFGTTFTAEDRVCIQELEERLAANAALEASFRANTPDNARLAFDNVVNDLLQDMVDGHFKFYKQVTDDTAFARTFLDILFDRYRISAIGLPLGQGIVQQNHEGGSSDR